MNDAPILIVEDDADNVTLTLFALEETGIKNRIVLAHDGIEALELLFAPGHPLSPALILLDVAMPRMDGWETLARLRRDPLTAGVPVLIVTSSELGSAKPRARSLGADGCLSKNLPYDRFVRELAKAAAEALGAESLYEKKN